MQYEKPVVMDLSSGARARGQEPLACISGSAASGYHLCNVGTEGISPVTGDCWAGLGASQHCAAGPDAQSGECAFGNLPEVPGECINGPSALF
jgi:hypothetical protein